MRAAADRPRAGGHTVWTPDLQMRKAGAGVEVHRSRGAGHLSTDPDLPPLPEARGRCPQDHDAEAAERTWRIALDFLADPQAQ